MTVVEYLDFECPYCAMAEEPIRELLEEYGDEVSLIARHFPLSDIHEFALPAALAAEAAGLQGKYWEMHDLLFERQEQLSDETIVEIAEEFGLDLDRFERDRNGAACRERVEHDLARGEREGVDSTPTVFVNGRKLDDGVTLEALREAVSEALDDLAA